MIARGVFVPLLWGAVGAATATMASAQDSKTGVKEQQQIVIIEQADGKLRPAGAPEFRIRRGADGRIELPEGCTEGSAGADLDEKKDQNQARVLMCTKAGGTAAERITSLEKVKDRLASNQHLSGETRAKIVLQLDAQIARLRAAK